MKQFILMIVFLLIGIVVIVAGTQGLIPSLMTVSLKLAHVLNVFVVLSGVALAIVGASYLTRLLGDV